MGMLTIEYIEELMTFQIKKEYIKFLTKLYQLIM
jgi:hypothetical protein